MEDKPEDEIERVTLSIKNVDPVWRNIFTQWCNVRGEDRGEVITRLMRQEIENRYPSPEGALMAYEEEAERIIQMKQRREQGKAAGKVITTVSSDENTQPITNPDLEM